MLSNRVDPDLSFLINNYNVYQFPISFAPSNPGLQAFLPLRTAILPPYWTFLRHAPIIYLEHT